MDPSSDMAFERTSCSSMRRVNIGRVHFFKSERQSMFASFDRYTGLHISSWRLIDLISGKFDVVLVALWQEDIVAEFMEPCRRQADTVVTRRIRNDKFVV